MWAYPEPKPLSRFTSLYDKPRLVPELFEAGGVEAAGAVVVCVVGLMGWRRHQYMRVITEQKEATGGLDEKNVAEHELLDGAVRAL